MGRKPMDREGLTMVNYWIRPITRVRIKEMAKGKKPVGKLLMEIVDKEYENFKREAERVRRERNGDTGSESKATG